MPRPPHSATYGPPRANYAVLAPRSTTALAVSRCPRRKSGGALTLLLAILAILVIPAAAQPSFDHKSALAQTKGSCQPCHAAMATSKEITKRADRPVRHIRFNHELHLKLGNPAATLAKAIDNGEYLVGLGADPAAIRPHLDNVTVACSACHRAMNTVTGTLAKTNYPHMSDCLVCHNKIDNPFSCEKCHVEEPKDLRPVSHTVKGFADSHSLKTVSKAECAVCHGRKFSCLGCH